MGFIIHKYFLSKSLKAPAPSDTKKQKSKKNGSGGKQQPRFSQPPAGTSYHSEDHLTIPEHAYAHNTGPPAPMRAARLRRSSLSHAPTSSAGNHPGAGLSNGTFHSYRRSSMPVSGGGAAGIAEHSYRRSSMPVSGGGAASIAEGSFEDGSVTSFSECSFNRNRRSSLQPSTFYERQMQEESDAYRHPHHQVDYIETSSSDYYKSLDTKQQAAEDSNPYGYGDWNDTLPPMSQTITHPARRRYSRRSSAGSTNSSIDNMDVTDQETLGSQTNSKFSRSMLRQENKWLQLQLQEAQRTCAILETRLYGARDQIAYTNASWWDQFYDAQQRHQLEVFQTQRQAEQAANSVLEEEFDQLKTALTQMAEEETKLANKKKKDETKSNEDEHKMHQLSSEVQELKERHAQATENSKQMQNILEQEGREKDAMLEENQRRILWLEEKLQAALPEGDDVEDEGCHGENTTRNSSRTTITPQLVAVLQNQQSQLEERVQDLLLENLKLQVGQSQVYELQTKVKELQKSLQESQNQLKYQETWHQRQVEQWKEQETRLEQQMQDLRTKLQAKEASRESIRAEYAHRIEKAESESIALQEQLSKKEKQWTHRMNLKDRQVESLQNELSQWKNAYNDGNGVAAVTPVLESLPSELRKRDQTHGYEALTAATDDTIFEESGSSSSNSIPETSRTVEEGLPRPTDPTPLAQNRKSVDQQHQQQREKDLLLQIRHLTESEAKAKEEAELAARRIQLLESYLMKQEEVSQGHSKSETLDGGDGDEGKQESDDGDEGKQESEDGDEGRQESKDGDYDQQEFDDEDQEDAENGYEY